MKKKYTAEELTYEKLVGHAGDEVSVSAYGITGKARIMVDEEGDVCFHARKNHLWICYSYCRPELDIIDWIELDEKFELDWNEVIEHPVIVPGPDFHAGLHSYYDEMYELNRLIDSATSGFGYEWIDTTFRGGDAVAVVYYRDESVVD